MNKHDNVCDVKSIVTKENIVSSYVHVLDTNCKSHENVSQVLSSEKVKFSEKKKTFKRSFSYAMKMLTQYGESSTESSDHIDELMHLSVIYQMKELVFLLWINCIVK